MLPTTEKGGMDARPRANEDRRPGRIARLCGPIILCLVYYLVFHHFKEEVDTYYSPSTVKPKQPTPIDNILNGVSTSRISEFTDRYYLAGPHLMGENWALADTTKNLFEKFGFEAEIEQFDVLRNVPIHLQVDIHHKNSTESLDLQEDTLPDDPTTVAPDRIPVFHGYSANGSATGKLVYANYGRKEDFDQLKSLGVDLKGKIVLCRYGELFRGLKVKFAEQAGATAVLIYSDTRDDGIYTEANGYKPYPKGPARNPSSVQRGSVQDMGAAPGDPSTPGYPSVPGCDRDVKNKSIPKIPSIPISAANGERLLKLLGSETIAGVGPSKAEVSVVNHQHYEIVPIYNVIATLKGSNTDEIIIGNHRDAWVLGGADPNSGTATMLELARVLGSMAKKGWKPERTIKFASWDGEEYGMVGSTEHGEFHAQELMQNAVVYLNVDLAFSGPDFSVSASPMFEELVEFAASRVPSPASHNETLYDDWLSSTSKGELKAPGSGSDYVVFLDHLGIPSLDVGFEENGESPVYHYHSNYDSIHWMKTFGDTKFEYQASVAKFLGIMVEQLASSTLYPLRVGPYASFLRKTVEKYTLGHKNDTVAYSLVENTRNLHKAAVAYDNYMVDLVTQYKGAPHWWNKVVLKAKIGVANRKLKYFDRSMLHRDGLDGRSWYKHIVYAPGRYTGYAGQVLPALAEAIEDKDYPKFEKWANITGDIFYELTTRLS